MENKTKKYCKLNLLYIATIIQLLAYPIEASAQAPIVVTCTDKYEIFANDAANDVHGKLFGQNSEPPDAPCEFIYGNMNVEGCRSDFMFTDYAGSSALLAAYWGSTGLPIASYEIVWCDKGYNGAIIESPCFSSPDGQLFDMPTAGYYQLVLNYNGVPNIPNDFEVNFISINKINKIWIETDPVCANFIPPLGDNKYHFKIKTDPDISSVMFHTQMYVGSGCTVMPGIDIHFDATAGNADGTYSIPADASYNSTLPYIHNNWNSNYYPDYYTGIDPNDFSIPYDLTSTGQPCLKDFLPGGTHYGQQLYINLTFTDNIAYHSVDVLREWYTNTSLQMQVPVKILSPAVPAIPPISTTAIPLTGPPNATGIPEPSYDIYNYTVSGTEVWTPTNNPISTIYGGAIYGTIRVQNNIEILHGATLRLDGGMRLEMGPSATIVVDNASTTTGQGGIFDVIGLSTLTAYQGCDGTNYSMWGGVTVKGNSSFPQGAGSILTTPSPQGMLIMENAFISYANIAVQNGSDDAHSGGIIQAILDPTVFQNNVLDVKMRPYHNHNSAGVEIGSFESFIGSRFIFDEYNGMLSTKHKMVEATDIKGVYMDGCKFNNDITPLGLIGVQGTDAGMYIAGCTFTGGYNDYYHLYSFKSCIATTSVLGTGTPTISGNTI